MAASAIVSPEVKASVAVVAVGLATVVPGETVLPTVDAVMSLTAIVGPVVQEPVSVAVHMSSVK